MLNRRDFRPFTLAVVGLALVVVLLGLSVASLRQSSRARDRVEHTLAVKASLWQTLRRLTDAETGQRGYLLTGKGAYLEPYDGARRDIPQTLERLRSLLRENAAQQQRLAELESLANAKLSELSETVALQASGDHDGALAMVDTDEGKRTMDGVRRVAASMIDTEDALLAKRDATALRYVRACFVGIALASFSLVLVGVLLYFVGRRLMQREQAELRIADLERFAGHVAHDVKSPLATVGLALAIARHETEKPTVAAAIDRATRTLQRVGTLVDGLLTFARAGAPSSDDAHANVREVIDDVIDGSRAIAAERGVELVAVDVAPVSVACSAGVLTSVLKNLVENAIKYMGERPLKRVSVRARTRGATTRIEVRDTGPGVPRKMWTTVFDPHVRAPDASVDGYGLGLATARRLVEAHHGSVGVAANAPSGSVFWVELPTWTGRPSTAAASAPPIGLTQSAGSEHHGGLVGRG